MGKPRVVITGGGTAGHTNPGIAVGEALVELGLDASDIHFVGGVRGNEATLVPAAGFTIDLLPGRGIQRRLTWHNLGAVASLLAGLVRGFWYVLTRRPRVVLSLGGYAAFAVSAAALVLRVPVVVSEQNARASAVNRLVGKRAKVCALPFPGTDLPRGVVTGNPSRASVLDAVRNTNRDDARDMLELPQDRTVVAVWSGSLGATKINEAVRSLAERWADRSDVAIRHVIGHRDWEQFRTVPAVVEQGELVYQTVEYENQMPALLVAADVAVTRAGASTVAELAVAGLPAILVPLPHAPRDHQTANTSELVEAKAAVVVPDAQVDGERLDQLLTPLVSDKGKLEMMSSSATAVGRPDAALRVAQLVADTGRIQVGSTGTGDQNRGNE